MNIIDLSLLISHHMPRHPAPHLPEVEVVPVATHDVARRSVQKLVLGTHVATHVDAPFHALADGATLDQIPLDRFVGQAVRVDVAGKLGKDAIDVADIEHAIDDLTPGARVILATGWLTKAWPSPAYFTEGPFLTRAAARFLADRRPLLLGMDFPNVDSSDETKPGIPAPNHQILLGTGMVLLENLANLEKVPRTFGLIAVPLRIAGGDGCPVRALATW